MYTRESTCQQPVAVLQVAGAIYWSRQLLIRIEEPMKVFRDVKAVSSLRDFGRICKVCIYVALIYTPDSFYAEILCF